MTYAYYHTVKRGKTPPAAPSYQAAAADTEKDAGKFVCTVCGYVYDPAAGDPGEGIPPGTPFAQLPKGWVCPICGAGKEQFEAVGG